jgi:hypothetical protein
MFEGLDRDRLLIDLQQVNRHIERVEAHIARQRKIIAEMIEYHQHALALEAQELLESFKTLKDQHLDNRKRLLRELGNVAGGIPGDVGAQFQDQARRPEVTAASQSGGNGSSLKENGTGPPTASLAIDVPREVSPISSPAASTNRHDAKGWRTRLGMREVKTTK